MGRGRFFLERLTEVSEISTEAFPGQLIVELSGDGRILIENHCGVKGYNHEEIIVTVEFGFLSVTGSNLELARMTKEQLVICGRIDGITLHRRG